MEKERSVNLEFFRSLMEWKLRFNPRPSSNAQPTSIERLEVIEENLVDFHAEIARKVDDLIVADETETVFEEVDVTPEEKMDLNPEKVSFISVDET